MSAGRRAACMSSPIKASSSCTPGPPAFATRGRNWTGSWRATKNSFSPRQEVKVNVRTLPMWLWNGLRLSLPSSPGRLRRASKLRLRVRLRAGDWRLPVRGTWRASRPSWLSWPSRPSRTSRLPLSAGGTSARLPAPVRQPGRAHRGAGGLSERAAGRDGGRGGLPQRHPGGGPRGRGAPRRPQSRLMRFGCVSGNRSRTRLSRPRFWLTQRPQDTKNAVCPGVSVALRENRDLLRRPASFGVRPGARIANADAHHEPQKVTGLAGGSLRRPKPSCAGSMRRWRR